MTSFNALGFSITLLKATEHVLRYIDADATVPAWGGPFDKRAVDEITLKETVEAPIESDSVKELPASGIKCMHPAKSHKTHNPTNRLQWNRKTSSTRSLRPAGV